MGSRTRKLLVRLRRMQLKPPEYRSPGVSDHSLRPSDGQFVRFQPLPVKVRRAHRSDDRRVISGIIHIFCKCKVRRGPPFLHGWRKMRSCHFVCRCRAGGHSLVVEALGREPGGGNGIDRRGPSEGPPHRVRPAKKEHFRAVSAAQVAASVLCCTRSAALRLRPAFCRLRQGTS